MVRDEPLSERLRRAARATGVTRVVKGAIRRLGFDLVRRHYYSPIPDLAALPSGVWSRESDLTAVDFDPASGLEFLETELAPYISEYHPPAGPSDDPRTFFLENGLYESVDAETLYAMIRRFDPQKIVELGSGMSTLVIADALDRNASEETRHLVFDPHPRASMRSTLERIADLRPVPATEVPPAVVGELEAGDLLFVDTTHTVKLGSDVNRIVLDLLPMIAPGVLVHFHDIYLPWEYPREFVERRNFFWAEQYLLQAFLAFNQHFEVLFATHALERMFPREVARLVPSAPEATNPSAFWLRRVGS